MRRLVLIPLSVLAALATAEPSPAAPRLIAAVPADGAVVPAGEAVLIWRFDRPMRRDGWSVTGDPRAMPGFVGHPSFSADGRTFRQKIRLEPGRVYDVGVNSSSYRNFRSMAGIPAAFRRVRFRTRP